MYPPRGHPGVGEQRVALVPRHKKASVRCSVEGGERMDNNGAKQ